MKGKRPLPYTVMVVDAEKGKQASVFHPSDLCVCCCSRHQYIHYDSSVNRIRPWLFSIQMFKFVPLFVLHGAIRRTPRQPIGRRLAVTQYCSNTNQWFPSCDMVKTTVNIEILATSDLTITPIIATSDLTITPIIATSNLTITAIIATSDLTITPIIVIWWKFKRKH